MSGSVNRAIIVGNLGHDPELRYTADNRPVCNLSVATGEVFKDKSGARQERTEWHRVTVWGEQAETCAKYLTKGRSVYVEGRLQTRKWTGRDQQEKSAVEVVADRVVFLGGGPGTGAANGSERQPPPPNHHDEGPAPNQPRNPGGVIPGEDIPF